MNDYIPEDVEAPISFTGKIGGNLMTIRGNDTAQFLGRIDEFIEANAIDKVAEFNDLCNAASAVKEGFSGGNGGGNSNRRQSSSNRSGGNGGGGQRQGGASRPAPRQQSNQQNADVEYHPEGLTCGAPGCGKDIYLKNGVSKAGNAYQVWTCPDQARKGDGHFSEYVN